MRYEFASVEAIPPGFWKWPHISAAKEWADRMSGRLVVETDFMDRFEQLRTALGFPLIINSGYRTPEHNAVVSTTGDDGPHTTGRACDIRLYGERVLQLISVARSLGFSGFGLEQNAKTPIVSRYIHIDDLATPAFPRPTVWTY